MIRGFIWGAVVGLVLVTIPGVQRGVLVPLQEAEHIGGFWGDPAYLYAAVIVFMALFGGVVGRVAQSAKEAREWVPGRDLDRESCATCSYDLTGNESSVCPECGTEIELP